MKYQEKNYLITFISVAFALLLIAGCGKSWIKNTNGLPYQVEGEKTQDVRKDIFDPVKGKGFKDSKGKRRAAKTISDYKYSIAGPEVTKESKEGCSCTVTIKSIDIKLETSVKFPKWKNYKDASKECKAKWDEFMKNLKIHEEGHVKIYREGRKRTLDNLKKKWVGKSKTRTGENCKKACKAAWDQLDEEVKKDFETELKKIDDKAEKYDKDTKHGEKQGAKLEDC